MAFIDVDSDSAYSSGNSFAEDSTVLNMNLDHTYSNILTSPGNGDDIGVLGDVEDEETEEEAPVVREDAVRDLREEAQLRVRDLLKRIAEEVDDDVIDLLTDQLNDMIAEDEAMVRRYERQQ